MNLEMCYLRRIRQNLGSQRRRRAPTLKLFVLLLSYWTLDNPNRSGEPSTVLRVIDFGRFAGFRTLAKEASGTPSNYSGV